MKIKCRLLLLVTGLSIVNVHAMRRTTRLVSLAAGYHAVSHNGNYSSMLSGTRLVTRYPLRHGISRNRFLNGMRNISTFQEFPFSERTRREVISRYKELLSVERLTREYTRNEINQLLQLTINDKFFKEFSINFCKAHFKEIIKCDKGSHFLYGIFTQHNPKVLSSFVQSALFEHFEWEIIESIPELIQTQKGYLLVLDFLGHSSLQWNTNNKQVSDIIDRLKKNLKTICSNHNGIPLLVRVAFLDKRALNLVKNNFIPFIESALEYQQTQYVNLFLFDHFEDLEGMLLEIDLLCAKTVKKIINHDDLLNSLINLNPMNAHVMHEVLVKSLKNKAK